MPSPAFARLHDFISTAMQMSHVYQPVMLRTLIDNGGKASVSNVAQALLAEDRAQIEYYREITRRILPRNFGGSDDLSNLQALCYSCNAMKRDRDTVDFRGMAGRYHERQDGCVFCEMDASRIVASNELMIAIEDAFPVTEGHTLLIPKRHVVSPSDLFQPKLNAMWALSTTMRADLSAADPIISGFNFGSNDGASAGQTVTQAHFHIIPRRRGDAENPRGGIRGVIPGRQNY